MATKPPRQFLGFSRKTFTFLRDLGRHNDKAWFEAHRSAYEEHVLQPLRDLVSDVADFMLNQLESDTSVGSLPGVCW